MTNNSKMAPRRDLRMLEQECDNRVCSGSNASRSRNRGGARRRRARAVVAALAVAPQVVEQYPGQCQLLLEQLQGDQDSQQSAARALSGMVWEYSQDSVGCRVVQQALGGCPRNVTEMVTSELHGHVVEAVASPHANFVIQRVVEVMPTGQSSFVIKELMGVAAQTARHRFGCRIIIRLLEHSMAEPQMLLIIDEILIEAAGLCRHAFGNHVIQAILEHGLPEHRHDVAQSLWGRPADFETLLSNATSRHASHVMESVTRYCSTNDRSGLRDALLSKPEALAKMMQNDHGCSALRALLECADQNAYVETACDFILRSEEILATQRFGKALLDVARKISS